MRRACLVAALLLAAGGVRADSVPLYVMEVPPMSTRNGPGHGVVGDIVLEAMRRAGIGAQLAFPPNNRAIVTVQLPASRNLLIIPLARVPEREAHFTWIAPLYKVERAFFTTGARIDSYAQARAQLHSIAVARGTVTPLILRAAQIDPQHIHEISDNDNVPRMLLAGRMQAWFGPVEQMRVYLRGVERRDEVVEGAVVGSTDNYLACSRQCDPGLVAKLRAQISRMEHDGSIKAIRARYAQR